MDALHHITTNDSTIDCCIKMYRIQAVCLGHKKRITVDYQSVDQLKSVIVAEFDKYLVKDKVKKIPVEFILTYKDEATGNEKLLKDMNAIVNNKTSTIFPLSVKRVRINPAETNS
ncbi:unnamed protein product [Rotaria magnacalcarata]|uniref:Uncharacterized protein n=2 Tax=Rotaria magnacalcarata TaxID=392030 RepID=A0A815LR29_9BILA|nr:unnamed protein product [Rotaria magnacalcarata]CAF3909980.1 unnamed protein product [Rotaria magnacalcarata]CAF4090806.1 unnamed protein product [Rotaria magnacalcarata]CAF4258239.1 unnamed protein product [Rotaria magnacalcarata]